MQHMLTPYAMAVEPFVWWEGAFTDQELDWLQQQAVLVHLQLQGS